MSVGCLLYTSDAADEGLGVDLGGRRIIKKKKKKFFFFFFFIFFFFFKQKTAYEMLRSLVGSEMCIRDRVSLHLCGFIYLWSLMMLTYLSLIHI